MHSSPSRRLLAAAFNAAGQGWPVFPLRPYGKRPAIKAWPQRATCDPDQLAAWWQHAPYNVGIACGPAGLLVVDLDQPDDPTAPSGRAVFAALAARAGAQLEPTFRVATPSGGEHRYHTVGVEQLSRSTAGLLGSYVDTRGAGGYVIAAGSVRRIDGRPRIYRVTDAVAPTPAPVWLVDLLAPPPPPAPTRPSNLPFGAAYVKAAIAGECDAVRRAGSGTRNSTLFQAAVRLGTLVSAGLLDARTATEQLRAAASVHCGINGFTAAEADTAIANGLRYGQRRPRPVQGG